MLPPVSFTVMWPVLAVSALKLALPAVALSVTPSPPTTLYRLVLPPLMLA